MINTCEEIIKEKLDSRIDSLLPFFSVLEDADINDFKLSWGSDDLEANSATESVLKITVTKKYKVLLSTSGPADGFDFEFDAEGDYVDCHYFYQDGATSARRRVPEAEGQALADLFQVGPNYE